MAKNASADNSPKAEGAMRAYAPRALSQLLPGVTRTAYKRRSPAAAALMSDWATIVGPRLASETAPRRLTGTQLTISCSGPMAMELTHLSGVLIERINTASGRRLVERLRFVQDFAQRPALARPADRPLEVTPIEGMAGGALNEALAELRALIRRKKGLLF